MLFIQNKPINFLIVLIINILHLNRFFLGTKKHSLQFGPFFLKPIAIPYSCALMCRLIFSFFILLFLSGCFQKQNESENNADETISEQYDEIPLLQELIILVVQ